MGKENFVDLPAHVYKDYYTRQVGGVSLPYFSGGYNRQRGAGIGNFFGKMLRGVVMPALGKAASAIKPRATKHLLNFGQGVLTDIISGKNVGQSFKHRGLREAKGLASDLLTPGKTARRQAKPAAGRTARATRRITTRRIVPYTPRDRSQRRRRRKQPPSKDIFD